jgi:hypothetical protein
MVNIYLSNSGHQVLALSIPLSDIKRLEALSSLRPHKWRRIDVEHSFVPANSSSPKPRERLGELPSFPIDTNSRCACTRSSSSSRRTHRIISLMRCLVQEIITSLITMHYMVESRPLSKQNAAVVFVGMSWHATVNVSSRRQMHYYAMRHT